MAFMIDTQSLENLFRLSNFTVDASMIQQWQGDVSEWLEFFSLEDAPDPSAEYRFAGERTIHTIRKDDSLEPSLTSSDIKLYCKRFVDGFVALPEHKR
ncbi:hypothetical protein PVA45_00855 [Entomospira entomophila]|uniref:Uncharacterized protein n=1 Tax=Entomospira entomophila TaxID=2719988 RepID=A0A968GCS2_9SPIO|nr:hypothetical protein [Entomospira entomophilus]NIZ40069.1 hypothetical protein [Entomospira entomophilus]WDI35630.1 hypothetical protein PVA45_00855 [Entomospira entomophilus]